MYGLLALREKIVEIQREPLIIRVVTPYLLGTLGIIVSRNHLEIHKISFEVDSLKKFLPLGFGIPQIA